MYPNLTIISHSKSYRSQGFAFVRFCDPISATSALSALPGTLLHGRPLRCSEVTESELGSANDKREESESSASELDMFRAGDENFYFDESSAIQFALESAEIETGEGIGEKKKNKE